MPIILPGGGGGGGGGGGLELALDLDTVKAHLYVDITKDDELLSTYLAAATQYVENATATVILAREVTAVYECFETVMDLPMPTTSVTSVQYLVDGELVLIDPSEYRVTLELSSIEAVNSWPSDGDRSEAQVRITAQAGYAAEDVPYQLRQCILMLVGHWYENRESVIVGVTPANVPLATEHLLQHYRDMRGAFG